MKIVKSYRFKLRPTKTQARRLQHWLNICRFIYNLSLEYREMTYQDSKNLDPEKHKTRLEELQKTWTKFGLPKQYKDLPKIEGFEWLSDVPANTRNDVAERLENAYKKFFSGGGYPKFQGKHRYNSFTLQAISNSKYLSIEGNRIIFPKMGRVKFWNHRETEGKIKQAKVIQEGSEWWMSVICETTKEVTGHDGETVGIDFGINKFLSLSNGDIYKAPSEIEILESKINWLQKSLSYKKEKNGNRSKRYKDLKQQLSKTHRLLVRQKENYLHAVSRELAEKYGTIVVEKLALKNMTKSAKGDAENPGKNVKQKSGLNRSLLRMPYHKFLTFLEYKLKERGGQLIKVNPAYTSQTCHECKHIDKENRKGEYFSCCSCGHTADADVNAALNIKASVLANAPERAKILDKSGAKTTEVQGVAAVTL